MTTKEEIAFADAVEVVREGGRPDLASAAESYVKALAARMDNLNVTEKAWMMQHDVRARFEAAVSERITEARLRAAGNGLGWIAQEVNAAIDAEISRMPIVLP